MKKRSTYFLCMLGISLLIAGCAGSSPPANQSASAEQKPHAECLVCKHNADLACVDVKVEKDTPTYVYGGKTYYFCSEECKEACARKPQVYIGK